MSQLETGLTKLLGIKHPIFLAGMNKAAGPKLAAAVTNAGGLGVIGGVGFTPRILKMTIKHLKAQLDDPKAPFGVDLLIPKIGGTARKTNSDYTNGKLSELVDIIIESGAKLFVCAIGVPPREIVERLHKNDVLVMNMVGAPKHVPKALAVGVDLICAQGGEGGGHTGAIPTSLLIPKCVDLCKGKRMPLFPQHPVYVVGAGGIYDGRGLAMALSYGAHAVWVGTRFVASVEGGASEQHKRAVVASGYDGVVRTEIYTGRPMRVIKNPYVALWHSDRRKALMKELLAQGVIPHQYDLQKFAKGASLSKKNKGKLAKNIVVKSKGKDIKLSKQMAKMVTEMRPFLSGQVAGAIDDVLPARTIIENMVSDAVLTVRRMESMIISKL